MANNYQVQSSDLRITHIRQKVPNTTNSDYIWEEYPIGTDAEYIDVKYADGPNGTQTTKNLVERLIRINDRLTQAENATTWKAIP